VSANPESPGRERVRATNGREKTAKKRSPLYSALEIVGIVAAAFVIAMLVQAFLFKPFTVHQVSMQPTLIEGDRILINRVIYHFRDAKAGEVIVFHSPVTKGEDLVKRVVAVAGDSVAVRDGALYINGAKRDEPYLKEQNFGGAYPETIIPEGNVFVMGDNRNNSGDGRLFGPISKDLIIGEAFVLYWPLGHWGGV
jgi:signal peptidase I